MRTLIGLCLLVLMIMFSSNIAAQNIAFHKHYKLSIKPNYAFTASVNDSTSLTDGVYTRGAFWGSTTTVGWQNVNRVSITLDFGRVHRIKTVKFNTAQRLNAGVFFPKAIYVFGSVNGMQFTYLGNLISERIHDTVPGQTEVRSFILHNINFDVRYLEFVAIPKGKFLFCDEIEVTESLSASQIDHKLAMGKDRIDAFINEKSVDDIERSLIQYHVRILKSNLGSDTNLYILHNEKLKSIGNENLQNDSINLESLKMRYISSISNQFKKPLVVEMVNPWASMKEYRIPTDTGELRSFFIIPRTGVQYGAFLATNTTHSDRNILFTIKDSNIGIASLQLYEAKFVPAMNGETVPDPLIPVSQMKILAGQSQLFLIKLSGLALGNNISSVIVSFGNVLDTIFVNQKVVDISGFSDHFCNADVWMYLDDPLLKNFRKSDIGNDLFDHHINTIDVPPSYIPRFGNENFNKFINYVGYFKQLKNILLFAPHNSIAYPASATEYLSPSWKIAFGNWCEKLLECFENNNIKAKVYYYPYDEIHNQDEIVNFKAFISWINVANPDFKVFGTLSNANAVREFLPLLDISQVYLGRHLLDNVTRPAPSKQIWGYSVLDSARCLSPYFTYRLMAWKAFLKGLVGIGFWNYDRGSVAWNSLDSLFSVPVPRNNYAVIYRGRGGEIISSRRWEAFRLGIEDFSILQIYSNRFGLMNTTTLVSEVVKSDDIHMADDIRNYMLKRLINE